MIYPVNGPGSYQLIGRSAIPLVDKTNPLEETSFLARPGDIWKYRPVKESEYNEISVRAGTYHNKVKEIDLSPLEYVQKGKKYIDELMEDF